MDSLKLQTTMYPIQPSRTVDVESSPELALGEGLSIAEVGSRHAPMRQCNLDMQRHSDDVRYQDEGDANRPGGKGPPDDAVAEPEPITGNEGDFGWSHPGCDTASAFWGVDEVVDGEEIEVEAGDAHDWVVGVLLVLDGKVGKCVPGEGEVVV